MTYNVFSRTLNPIIEREWGIMFINIVTKFGKNQTKTTERRQRTTFVDVVDKFSTYLLT